MTPAAAAIAATPESGTATPSQPAEWSGTLIPGTAAGGTDENCFDADGNPDPTSGCDFFSLDVETPAGFYEGFLGGLQVTITGFAPADIDLGIFRRNPDGTRGERVGGSGNFPGEDEVTTVASAEGAYILAMVPYAVPPGQSYNGKAEFVGEKADPALDVVNSMAPPGQPNYRASHDQYLSHSEPSIAMDPLNPDHLIAGSKMYENLPNYLFKVGTYESFDGGRTWEDQGQLPGFCEEPPQCDPSDEASYRTVSDPSVAFDDEGNAYLNTLDAPGGTFAFTGFNMTLNIKRPGKPWSDPITVHDNRDTPITEQLLLDDKNWIAVDNVTDVDGGPNEPGDGKIGTMYICWSFDGSQAPLQQIVLMRSLDGGETWGGVAPGDNTPYQLSQKGAISGIGCHILIGPNGEVYVTWYDNQIDGMMQVKSTDRGQTFTPATPVALITGVNEPFEGQSFRNLSIPSTAIDKDGNIYIVAASAGGEGEPVRPGVEFEQLKERHLRAENEAEEDAGPGADIVMFKSTDGGSTYSGPVRVNGGQTDTERDQFQPWIAVTPEGQVNVSYFDRRNDPNNFFIDTYLSRSNDGGETFSDTRVTRTMWDPRLNPPVSVSGEFIGDYQGLVADDNVAIPFWNDTQAANLDQNDAGYSPYQEVWSARVPNGPPEGGPAQGCRDTVAPRARFIRKKRMKRKAIVAKHHRLVVRGRARDKSNCKAARPRVRSVVISVALKRGKRCRHLSSTGKFGPKTRCRERISLPTLGRKHWKFVRRGKKKINLKHGKYLIRVRALDSSGNIETKNRRKGRWRNFRKVRR
jgi:hypothetical protein